MVRGLGVTSGPDAPAWSRGPRLPTGAGILQDVDGPGGPVVLGFAQHGAALKAAGDGSPSYDDGTL
jgi:hypothetical protein